MDQYVRQHLKQCALAVLQLARTRGIGGTALGRLPAPRFLSTLTHPRSVLAYLNALHDPAPERLQIVVDSLLSEPAAEAGEDSLVPGVLSASVSAPGFFQSDRRPLAESDRVDAAWKVALAMLERIVPPLAEGVRGSVLLLAGVDGPFGQIIGFTNPHWPGAIGFGVNNPPVLLAEEVLHEATHVRLWSRLAVDHELAAYFDALPAIYSPFTESLRPAVRVLHGIASYAAVLRFWMGLVEDPDSGEAVDFAKAEARIILLRRRLGQALCHLLPHCGQGRLDSILYELAGLSCSDFPVVPATSADLLRVLGKLSPIERAEFQLAVAGTKVSRLCVPLDVGAELAHAAGPAVVAGVESIVPEPDALLGGFSNRVGQSRPLLHAQPDDEIFLYVAATPDAALSAWRLDRNNGAGERLGIPECCRRFFSRAWPDCLGGSNGDLFAHLLRANGSGPIVTVDWRCNAAAMYFGGGLCWHFPCELQCKRTADVMEKRFASLTALDAALATELRRAMQLPFLWSAELGYARLPDHANPQTPLSAATWLRSDGSVDVKDPHQTLGHWLASGHDRLLILPSAT